MLMGFAWQMAAAYSIKATEIGVPKSTGTLTAGVANITQLLMSLIGMMSIVFIIVGAIQMAYANGDPKNFARGRETVLYAAIGLAVSIAAYAIVSYIAQTVK